jgi:hypothetical protein
MIKFFNFSINFSKQKLKEQRRFWIFVFGLAFIVLASICLANYYYIVEIDKKYSSIINREIPALNIVQSITRENARTQQNLVALMFAEKGEESELLNEAIKRATLKNDKNMQMLLQYANSDFEKRQISRLAETRKDYRQNVKLYLNTLEIAQKEKAVVVFQKSLKPAFEIYQTMQQELALHYGNIASILSTETGQTAKIIQNITINTIIALGILLGSLGLYLLLLAYSFFIKQ